uniref:Uncharacterized protein n=1 Tax=Rhizophora mucronata TaxID=61149 RepID=A0A2P2PNN6_RHIMU
MSTYIFIYVGRQHIENRVTCPISILFRQPIIHSYRTSP